MVIAYLADSAKYFHRFHDYSCKTQPLFAANSTIFQIEVDFRI